MVDLPPGNENLRRQIALRYMRIGISQPADEIVVTNGALEALNLCLMAVTQPGDDTTGSSSDTTTSWDATAPLPSATATRSWPSRAPARYRPVRALSWAPL